MGGVEGGCTLPEGSSEGIWGWEPHTFVCENCIDSILSEQHSKSKKNIGDNFCLLPLQVQYVARTW